MVLGADPTKEMMPTAAAADAKCSARQKTAFKLTASFLAVDKMATYAPYPPKVKEPKLVPTVQF